MPTACEVLARDEDGKPCFTLNKLGKGNVLFFNAPIEEYLAKSRSLCVDGFSFEEVYAAAMKAAKVSPTVLVDNKNISVTAHPYGTGYIVVAVNDTDEEQHCTFGFNGKIVKAYYGAIGANGFAAIPPADAVVFCIEK